MASLAAQDKGVAPWLAQAPAPSPAVGEWGEDTLLPQGRPCWPGRRRCLWLSASGVFLAGVWQEVTIPKNHCKSQPRVAACPRNRCKE